MIHLADDEKVLLEVRRHWYVLLAESFMVAILFLLPWAVFFGIETLSVDISTEEGSLLFFSGVLWLFVTWMIFIIVWTNYYLDVWIVTDRRIIDIEQFGLFRRDMSEFRLDRIQDVTIEVKGILPTLLHFGDIHVQTAGEGKEFIIRSIPNPYKFRDALVKEHDRAVVEMRGQDGHV